MNQNPNGEKIPAAGRVVMKLGDDISTDAIYPGRFMATVLPGETPQYAFADYPEFRALVQEGTMPAGSIVVAGANFGCGSSREQAASSLRGHNLTIVARSFARIFLQNAVNLGLLVVACPEIEASVGDDIQIDRNAVLNKTTGRSFTAQPLPPARQAIMEAGGLIAYTRKRLVEKERSNAER